MMKIFKNRIVLASALFGLLDFLQGFIIASPILIYLRLIYENKESSLSLWPLPSARVITDFILNHNDVIIFYLITASVLYTVYFIFKTLFAGGIYSLILFEKKNDNSIKSSGEFMGYSTITWTGFLKVGLFAIIVYTIAFFIGSMFGDFVGRFSGFLKVVIIALFLLMGSTYLQILRIHIVASSDNSLRRAMAGTKEAISKGFLRLIMGNVSVSIVVFILVMVMWFILRALKSSEWNVIIMIFTIIVQQLMVFTICLGQSLRINFNYSVIKKGENNALGGDELG